jgi:flagellar biosynthesis protein FliP
MMFIISKLCYLCVIHLKHVRTIQMTDQLTAVYHSIIYRFHTDCSLFRQIKRQDTVRAHTSTHIRWSVVMTMCRLSPLFAGLLIHFMFINILNYIYIPQGLGASETPPLQKKNPNYIILQGGEPTCFHFVKSSC